ncbi:GNAT family N-acetyltransferase [Paraliomyxa miuraensis]|uniref:GNAT family N-acetyltransferase n=1 Tax=Paraliomyxa miuraensis TaxID=376150 RepID=UPI002253A38D|nr:GNAT family N-acetyltransferase [Paraliomyxa miuraensis]MCX4243028.1 GNAT family N-acetyltransferase [Paraliomyxa miuraensis]
MLDHRPPARRPDGKLELVTTYLELRTPPRHPRVSITGRTLALVHAKRPPLHFYRYLYHTVGAPYLWWQRRALSDEALASIIHDERVHVLVLQVDGVPAGFAELDRRSSANVRGDVRGTVRLSCFGLVPEFVGQGLGLPFLSRVLDHAWQQDDVERIVVHAHSTDHPRALLVYQRVGFAPYDVVREEFDDPRDRGLFPEFAPIERAPTVPDDA